MKNDLMFGYLIHLSFHMWEDENAPARGKYEKPRYCENNNVDVALWDKLIDFLSERKYNMLLIDVGDGIKYESHPEISAPDAWDKDFLKQKLAEIRAKGMVPIPKLNFSCCHHTWLKEYRRMVSTPVYYKVCTDLIKEVCELFDYPEFIHLGMDEENALYQKYRECAHIRQGELLWHDMYFYFKEAEKHGARPWIWSDYCWSQQEEFLKRMPKSVLQSNWYYGFFDDNPTVNARIMIDTYELLDKHGFEQIPTCSCWDNTGARNVFQTLTYGKDKLSEGLLRGYMVAPWGYTTGEREYQLKHDGHTLYCARQEIYQETLL